MGSWWLQIYDQCCWIGLKRVCLGKKGLMVLVGSGNTVGALGLLVIAMVGCVEAEKEVVGKEHPEYIQDGLATWG